MNRGKFLFIIILLFLTINVGYSQRQFNVTVNNSGEVTYPLQSINFPYGIDGYATSDTVDVINDSIALLDQATPRLGETNIEPISFANLTIGGPLGRKQRSATGSVIEIDWESDVDVVAWIDESTTFSQTGIPKEGQTISILCWNTNSFNNELIFDGLGWSFQRTPSVVLSESWVQVFVTYSSERYTADASAPAATTRTDEGGTSRSSHPQNSVLVGDGPNALKAAAIGDGLNLSGTGQNMTLSVQNAIADSDEREITIVTGGGNHYTNLTVLSPDTSTFISADVIFASVGGSSAAFQTAALFEYEDGESVVVDTNQVKIPSGTSLWAGWVAGHTANRYPVLVMGGLDSVTGIMKISNFRRTEVNLINIPTIDPWNGYVWTESFEGTGTENNTIEVSGTIDFDATDYKVHGNQSAKIEAPSTSAAVKWLLPSSYGTASGRLSIRVNQNPAALRNVFTFRDDSDNIVFYISVGTSRTLRITDGNNASATTASGFSNNEWITIYYEYTKGTGANDAVAKIGWSNDGTKTSNANNIATIVNCNMTTDVGRVQLRNSNGADAWTVWYDAIVVHPSFDWDDLPAGLPSGM